MWLQSAVVSTRRQQALLFLLPTAAGATCKPEQRRSYEQNRAEGPHTGERTDRGESEGDERSRRQETAQIFSPVARLSLLCLVQPLSFPRTMSMASAEDGEYGFAAEYKELSRQARRQRQRAARGHPRAAGITDSEDDCCEGMDGDSEFERGELEGRNILSAREEEEWMRDLERARQASSPDSFPPPPPPPPRRHNPAAAAAASSSSAAVHPLLAPNGVLWNSPRSIDRVCMYWTWGRATRNRGRSGDSPLFAADAAFAA